MTEEDKIYAAAVVDSGSWMSLKNGNKWSANIRIRRGATLVLEDINRVFGGYIGQGKTEFYLNFNGRQCTEFLMQILPYMKVKIRQAQILMEFNEHLAKRAKSGASNQKLTTAEFEFRMKLVDELKFLQ